MYTRNVPRLHRILTGGVKRDWDDFPSLPKAGPAILVGNHLSTLDAPVVADYILYHGRYPYFLAKVQLWNVPVLRGFLTGLEQIPVYRGTARAMDALVEAKRKLEDGKIVFIFPEGTTARDPLEWPFAVKTGTARLAIETGVPVIPIGHWGVNFICPDNENSQKVPYLLPRHWVCFRSGEPLDLSAFGRDVEDRDAVRGASVAILEGIVAQVERARGETAPPLRFNPRTGDYVPPDQAVW